eukprot:1562019-Prymnesium_polylepis.1
MAAYLAELSSSSEACRAGADDGVLFGVGEAVEAVDSATVVVASLRLAVVGRDACADVGRDGTHGGRAAPPPSLLQWGARRIAPSGPCPGQTCSLASAALLRKRPAGADAPARTRLLSVQAAARNHTTAQPHARARASPQMILLHNNHAIVRPGKRPHARCVSAVALPKVHWARVGLSYDEQANLTHGRHAASTSVLGVWLGLHVRARGERPADLARRWVGAPQHAFKPLAASLSRAVDGALAVAEAELARLGAPLTRARRREADADDAAAHIARAMAQASQRLRAPSRRHIPPPHDRRPRLARSARTHTPRSLAPLTPRASLQMIRRSADGVLGSSCRQLLRVDDDAECEGALRNGIKACWRELYAPVRAPVAGTEVVADEATPGASEPRRMATGRA